MTLGEFIINLAEMETYPKKVRFDGLVYELEGDNHEKMIWMEYRHTESDGCYDLLSRYCLTPFFLEKSIEIIKGE